MDIITFFALVVSITLAIMGWALAHNRKRDYRSLHQVATDMMLRNFDQAHQLIDEQQSSAFWQDMATMYATSLSDALDVLERRTQHDGWTCFDQTQAETDTDYAALVRSAYHPDHTTPRGLFNIGEMLSDDEEASIKLAQVMLGATIIDQQPGLFEDDCGH